MPDIRCRFQPEDKVYWCYLNEGWPRVYPAKVLHVTAKMGDMLKPLIYYEVSVFLPASTSTRSIKEEELFTYEEALRFASSNACKELQVLTDRIALAEEQSKQ